MSEPGSRHRLHGLAPDNLLAFLALLGLLRAIQTARPDWRPRAAWDIDQPPLRPLLVLAEPTTQEGDQSGCRGGCEPASCNLRVRRRNTLTPRFRKISITATNTRESC
jgi:hypothetical protein